jgi:carboxymethylenebutenolidase
VLRNVKAAAHYLGGPGEAGIVGYCFGGLVVWLAACRLDFACVSSYYGRTIERYVGEVPDCPTICHFGAKD